MHPIASFTKPLARPHRRGARAARVLTLAVLVGALAACAPVDRTGRAFWQPYRPNVQQGNWITAQQVALLRPGMTREQVRFALGTPTLTPVFHADRWEYPYFLKPGYGQIQERRFTVYFENDLLVRWEGDAQPSVQPFQQAAPEAAEAAELNPQRLQEEERLNAGLPADAQAAPEPQGDAAGVPEARPAIGLQQEPAVDPATLPQGTMNPTTTGTVPLR